ncbi:MAG: sulfotransferase [Terrimicrobiaceae bacterium]|nr:sulfotransferase [Terrimicrobiaceae bacterium]
MTRPPDLRFEIEKAWRLFTALLRPLPAFVIPGAPKCGTSMLYEFLVTHPRIRRGVRKEPTNFVHWPGSRLRAAMNYPIRWPGANFIVGDGSVEYFTNPVAPRNVHDVLPNARLVFLFRDPVVRAWSDYQMFRKFGTDTADFSTTVRRAMRWLDEPSVYPLVDAAARQAWHPARYVLCGWYARALERWLAVFPREQCLFLISEEFFADPLGTTRAVLHHIRLPEADIPPLPVSREGCYAESMPAEIEAELRAFYAPRNRELSRLLGRDLPWA